MKLRDLEKHLRQHGCYFHREGSRHSIWKHQDLNTTTAVPRKRVIKDGTVSAICRDLGIPKPE